jgi:hypothetical protein
MLNGHALNKILLCASLMFLMLGPGASSAFAKSYVHYKASVDGKLKFGVKTVYYYNKPEEYWGGDGAHYVADYRVWLQRDPDHKKHDWPEYTFASTFFAKNKKNGVGLMDVVILAKNYGVPYASGDDSRLGAPIYKVRLYPLTSRTRKKLKEWPTFNSSFQGTDSRLRLPVILPVDRTPNAQGYIETDWIACPKCFATTMEGEKDTSISYADDKQLAAAKIGFPPAITSGYFSSQDFGLHWDQREDNGFGEIRRDDVFVGADAIAWAEHIGQTLKAKKARLADAPKLYAQLRDEYNEISPVGALASACPNRLNMNHRFSGAHQMSELEVEIKDIEDEYEELRQCFSDFFDGYDSSEWLETMPDFIAREAELAELAETLEADRFEISVKRAQQLVSNYLDDASEEANGQIGYRIKKAEKWQRQWERDESEAQMWASIQNSMRATADKFSRDVAQTEYEMSVRRSRMKVLTNPDARSVETLLPGATLDAKKLAAKRSKDRLEREKMERERKMAEAEAAAKAEAEGEANAGEAPDSSNNGDGENSEPQNTADNGAIAEAGKDAGSNRDEGEQEFAQAEKVELPEPEPVPEPEPAPPEPIYVYSAITAKYESEGRGTTKENLIYDMDGEVVLTDNFYRNATWCRIDTGKILVIEWTWLKGGSPSFASNYFSTPRAALDDWWQRRGETSVLNRVSDTRSELEDMSMMNEDCTEITGGFTDY